MDERSTFFVELPSTAGLDSLRERAGSAIAAAGEWCGRVAQSACANASSWAQSWLGDGAPWWDLDTWQETRDKCRPWLVGVGAALALVLSIAAIAAAVIHREFPHPQHQLSLHHAQPFHSTHPAQRSSNSPPSRETPAPTHGSSSSSSSSTSSSGNHPNSESTITKSVGREGSTTSNGSTGEQQHSEKLPGDSAAALLAAALETAALQLPGSSTRAELQAVGSEQVQARVRLLTLLSPTLQKEKEVTLIWQIPPHPRGVLLLLHACGMGPALFWPPHPNCSRCTGLPEEQAITVAAIRRGYAVIGVRRRHSTCWDASWPQSFYPSPSPAASSDVALVSSVLNSWRAEKGLEHLPLFALGISSGGAFATVLAHALKFKAIALYLSAGQPRALSSSKALNTSFPPALFVHMPKDSRTARFVTAAVQGLKRMGAQAAQLRLRPLSLSPLFLSDRIPFFPVRLSEEIFGAFKMHGLLDKDGFLLSDPRGSKWLQILQRDGIFSGPGSWGSKGQSSGSPKRQSLASPVGTGPLLRLSHPGSSGHGGLYGPAQGRGWLRGRAKAGKHRLPHSDAPDAYEEHRRRLAAQQGGRKQQEQQGAEALSALKDARWQQRAVEQELNLAFGLHEVSSDKLSETFEWFNDRCWYNGRYQHHRCSRFYSSRRSNSA